ncbi:MAG: aspartate-semialdehyde dehydrogenase [SAR86 cluster bacterium]|uniref:Aspartate-semialdehyde dehydrogenase n=1 Tax=SAR86 cluster bacterium TaxID=2030880 RepID=A0A368BMB1_9GAMM|nr:MAG: aspartate-semialdehyde dehydrogenase [SAR86 cluster bacterium]|tara:strand:+ start:2443 stop:3432 length:990 start_codon:yes stop_codon:yes gene_type:complete
MIKVAVAGATGVVGTLLANYLTKENLELDLYASEASVGKTVNIKGKEFSLKPLVEINDTKYDYIFLAISAENTKALKRSITYPTKFLDLSSAYRQDPDTPLLLYGVNHQDYSNENFIALPNCVVAPVAKPIKIISNVNLVKNIFISTYQSISGAGREKTHKLLDDTTKDLEALKALESKFDFSDNCINQINSFNVVPAIDDIYADGSTGEETKIKDELSKILKLSDVTTIATCVRVPVIRGHCASINIVSNEAINLTNIKEQFLNDPELNFDDGVIPSPRQNGNSEVISIGRLRVFQDSPNVISFWVVGDNLNIGAAGNAYRIFKYIND